MRFEKDEYFYVCNVNHNTIERTKTFKRKIRFFFDSKNDDEIEILILIEIMIIIRFEIRYFMFLRFYRVKYLRNFTIFLRLFFVQYILQIAT